MTMPKKGRREIIVDEILYHYKISGSTDIRIENTDTGESIEWSQDNKPKWRMKTSPGFIRHLIETNGNPTEEMDHFYWASKEQEIADQEQGHEFTLKFNMRNNYNTVDHKHKTLGEKTSIANNVRWIIDNAQASIAESYGRGAPRRVEMDRLCLSLKMQLMDQLTEDEAIEINLIRSPQIVTE